GTEPYDSVWVVDRQGRVRGKSAITDMNGTRLTYITVFGNGEGMEDLRFFFGNDGYRMATSGILWFTPDRVLGTVTEPYQLGMAESSIDVFPNEFSAEIRIRFNAQYEQNTTVRLRDIVGHEVYKEVRSVHTGYNELIVVPRAADALYMLT